MRRGPVRSQPPHARCSSPCGSVENRRNLSPYRVSNPFGHERIRAHMSGYAARRPRARRHRSIRGIRGIRGIRALDEARAGNDAQRQRLEQGTGNREQGIRNGRERDRERETERERPKLRVPSPAGTLGAVERGIDAYDDVPVPFAAFSHSPFPVPRSLFPVPCSLSSRQRVGHDSALVTTAHWSRRRIGHDSALVNDGRITARRGQQRRHCPPHHSPHRESRRPPGS